MTTSIDSAHNNPNVSSGTTHESSQDQSKALPIAKDTVTGDSDQDRDSEPAEKLAPANTASIGTTTLRSGGVASRPKKKSTPTWKTIRSWPRGLQDWWGRQIWWPWETISWILSLAFLLAIVILLVIVDNRPIPQWSLGITPNALISVFATISAFLLAIPVAAAIGQLKWIWFRKSHLVTDFETIDEASKGPLGSAILLWKWRGGSLAVLGASITILMLAIGPFIQQIIIFEGHTPIVAAATIPVALNYTQQDVVGGDVDLNVKAAVYRGAFNPAPISTEVVPSCPTGNCTWPSYRSLAVCSACANITDEVRLSEDGTICMLPNGFTLNITLFSPSDDEFSVYQYGMNVTNGYTNGADSLPSPMAFKNNGTVLLDMFAISLNPFTLSSCLANECMLQFCVKTFNATVRNGYFQEQELHHVGGQGQTISGDSDYEDFEQDQVFRVDGQTIDDLAFWLSEEFIGNVSTVLDFENAYTNDVMQSIFQALTGAYTSDQDTEAFVPDLRPLFDNVADALTTTIRNDFISMVGTSPEGKARGIAERYDAYIHVRWAWIILPAVLQVSVLVFLFLVIWDTHRSGMDAYKGGVLSILFHGIDEDSRQQMEPLNRTIEMDTVAEETFMKLAKGSSGWRLMPIHRKKFP